MNLGSSRWKVMHGRLNLRAKISLGFAAVLVISLMSMVVAYVGFANVARGASSYRKSVGVSDLARNIDRELLSYQSAAKLYVVTGKEDDATLALSAEKGLSEAIDRAAQTAGSSSRAAKTAGLVAQNQDFSRVFGTILQVRRESISLSESRILRGGAMLRYKLEDIAGSLGSGPAQADAKQVLGQFAALESLAKNYVVSLDIAAAKSFLARVKFVENALRALASPNAELSAKVDDAKGQLASYAEAFARLSENAGTVARLVGDMAAAGSSITQLSAAMKDDILADQRRFAQESDVLISETERHVAALSLCGFVLGVLLAWLLGRGISRPITGMCVAMRELAGGNFSIVLPGMGRGDELGDMAAAVEEFKIRAIERAEREAAGQEEQRRVAAEARRTELNRFADNFEAAVGTIVSNVSASAVQLEAAAGTLSRAAETTQGLSNSVAGASDHASSHMQLVVTAATELSGSVVEIGSQVRVSSEIAESAVAQARMTDIRMSELSKAAQQIGDVLKMITSIAEQTNLLALNATIEAARAGDAGKGFSIVATEVKTLASQTAAATSGIYSQISAVQQATSESVSAINEISATIVQISDISSTISTAVEKQAAATQDIAQTIRNVASGIQSVASDMSAVKLGAGETGAASDEVFGAARKLAAESARLRGELDRFVSAVRAA